VDVPVDDGRWTLKQAHVRQAIEESRESSPGPDGIPYRAWKKIMSIAVPVLHNVAVAMQDPATLLPRDFNTAFLCCLPRKPSGHDATHGDFYAPKNTRPLSLVDTANRLIANSYRLMLEPLFNKLVSDMQRGFLKGRSILRNVLEIDWESMRVSLLDDRGALVLFDFEAAFPSLSQEFMFEALEKLGLPPPVLQVIRFLYQSNNCIIKLKGHLFEGFPLTSGVRQGCPLSPLLFVATIDILLRRLHRLFPGSLVRAFADDNAMVIRDFPRAGSGVLSVYKEFSKFSGLHVNMPKTVIIPLWASSLDSIRRTLIADSMPEWSQVALSYVGVYLGFAVGPKREGTLWNSALTKFVKKTDLWKAVNIGMQYTARTYNAFTLPIFSYLGQLCEPSDEVYQAELSSLAKLSHGPGNWCTAQDLWYLGLSFSSTFAFKTLKFSTWASKLRLVFVECHLSPTSWNAHEKAQELRECVANSSRPLERAEWFEWYQSSFACSLDNAAAEAEALGISTQNVYNHLRNKLQRSPGSKADASALARKALQHALYDALLSHPRHKPNPEERVRHKMKRWDLKVPEGWLCRRVLRHLDRLSSLVPPRVYAACFRTIWNGWCTDARFRNIENRYETQPCVLCCSERAEDRIEHYALCPLVVDFARRYLGMGAGSCSRARFLFGEAGLTDEAMTISAILVYSVYRTTNSLRRAAHVSPSVVFDCLEQYAKAAVDGHPRAKAVLQSRVMEHHVSMRARLQTRHR